MHTPSLLFSPPLGGEKQLGLGSSRSQDLGVAPLAKGPEDTEGWRVVASSPVGRGPISFVLRSSSFPQSGLTGNIPVL